MSQQPVEPAPVALPGVDKEVSREDVISDSDKLDLSEGVDVEEAQGSESEKALERRLVRKIDLRMSVLVVIYIMNYIDRNAASAARLATYEKDLNLKENQFATIIAVYFIGYIVMQVPSNMILNHIGRPSLYIPATTFIWGIISCGTGITRNFTESLVCRFFLGIVEASFFPGALLLMSRWYKRDELGLRSSILFCGLLISVGFGNLIASGILANMHGVLGHSAWRWLFFIEGAITLFVAVIAAIVLPDFPENTNIWFSEEERQLAIRRLATDSGRESDKKDVGQLQGFKDAMKDWKVWWLTLIYGLISLTVTYVLYLPTLAKSLGFGNNTVALLLCAPPSLVVAVTAFFNGRHSDKSRERCYHIVVPYIIAIVGHTIVIATTNTAARYFGFFLIAQGPAGTVCFLAWVSNSFPESHAKRAVALGIIYSLSQIGAIAGSYIYPDKWRPAFRQSFGINIAACIALIISCLFFRRRLISLNSEAEKDEGSRSQVEPGYRYML